MAEGLEEVLTKRALQGKNPKLAAAQEQTKARMRGRAEKIYSSTPKIRDFAAPYPHIFSESEIAQHPTDLPETFIEQLVKVMGRTKGTFFPSDATYLEQYFHPQRDILERTDLRPTQARLRNMVYRKPAAMPENYAGTPKLFHGSLGHFKYSETPEYSSVYDVYDFKNRGGYRLIDPYGINFDSSSILDPLAREVMKRVGTPYVIYGRYPKDEK